MDSQASTGGNFATSATGIFHIVGHNANSGSTVSPLAWFTVRDNDGAYYAKEHMRQFIMLPGQRSSTYLGPSGKFQRSGTHRAAMYVMMGGGANYAGVLEEMILVEVIMVRIHLELLILMQEIKL